MRTFTSISEAACSIQEFLYDRAESLPADIRDRLKELTRPTSSPVDAVVKGAEMLYARKDEIDKDAKELGAALALMAEQYNFHGLAEDQRGSRIAGAFMREAKTKLPGSLKHQDKEKDVEPSSEFIKQEVEVEEAEIVQPAPEV